MKTCKHCNIEQPLEKFYKSKDGKYGVGSKCKDCTKKYYQENKDKAKEYGKKYREANREKALEYGKEYRKKNKEALREYDRKRYRTLEYKIADKKRRSTPEYKEKEKMRYKTEKHRRQNNEAGRRYRARKRNATIEHFSYEELVQFWKVNGIDEDTCVYCGAPKEHIDHVIALAAGGSHTRNNLVPACRSCNCSKKDLNLAEWIDTKKKISTEN
jgi:Zn ribbon nucleic-acid-binding protein